MTRNALRERSHRHDYYSFNRWVALMRDALTGLREALKGGSLAAFIVRNRIRRCSLLELDSILASLGLEAGFRVEALYSAPAPKSLWANLLAKKGLRLPPEDRVVRPQALGQERKRLGLGEVCPDRSLALLR